MRLSLATAYWRLTRPPIVALVLLAMAVSAWTTARSPLWPLLGHALLGTAMVIAGAITLNQRLECQGDAIMSRTATRPVPSGNLSRGHATRFGLVATAIGFAYLSTATSMPLTLLTAAGWLAYVGIYTPLKTRSAWQTPIGAAAGATPVLLGAAAAGDPFSPWALTLFGIVFFWQFPHAMAIAWRYRREFAAAGVKVATVTDPTGRTASIWAVAGAAAMLPVSLTPLCLSLAGVIYGGCATVLGVVFLGFAVFFAARRDDITARRLLWASLIYLPAMLAVVMFR